MMQTKPPAVPIPDLVLRNGKSANPRGFSVGYKAAQVPAADLWHCVRRRRDMPVGYVVIARVVPDVGSGWQVLGE